MNSDLPPNSVEAAVECVIAQLTEDEAQAIKTATPDDVVMMNFGLGMWIRNHLALWAGSPLYDFLAARGFDP